LQFEKILLIQTAFIGDAVLMTPLLEKLHQHYPESKIDILVRKGNESLFDQHPFINEVLIWNKKKAKYKNLFSTLSVIRKNKYDLLVNLQKHFSTGILSAFSKAKKVIGFKQNPFSIFFQIKINYENWNKGFHEIERNHFLIQKITDDVPGPMKLYPSSQNHENVSGYITEPYITICPASVWFTKQLPIAKWLELIKFYGPNYKIFLLGGPDDTNLCNNIKNNCGLDTVEVLAGKLSFLDSAALFEKSFLCFSNDSGPLHIASAVNAKIIAFFLSTLPSFGFSPRSKEAKVIEIKEELKCRPCGNHGHQSCPKGHFKCGNDLDLELDLLKND